MFETHTIVENQVQGATIGNQRIMMLFSNFGQITISDQIISFPINSLPEESRARSPDGLCILNRLARLFSIMKPCVMVLCLNMIRYCE